MKKTRTIVTKHKTYELSIEVQGVPVEEHFSGVSLPPSMGGALVYDTEDGKVIAHRLQEDGEANG